MSKAKNTAKKAKQSIEQVKEQLNEANQTLWMVLSEIGEEQVLSFLGDRLVEDLKWAEDGIISAEAFVKMYGGGKKEVKTQTAIKKETEAAQKQFKAFFKQYTNLKEKRGY